MTRVAHSLTIFVVCAAVAPGAGGGKGKFPERAPSYGGGPVQNPNAAAYSAKELMAYNVPELTTDNKNTLVLKYPGKLLLSASSIYAGWPEALAFDGNPHSSWFTATGDAVAHGTKPWISPRT